VQLRHRNFVSYIRSYIIQSADVILHQASVTFDAHLEEILGALMMGGQLVLLPPDGHLDMDVLSTTISSHQVTFLCSVPSVSTQLVGSLHEAHRQYALKTLARLSFGGEALFTRTIVDVGPYLSEHCCIYNYYGPAECTEAVIEHLISPDDLDRMSIPLGRPMANVHIYLLDDHLQPVIPGIHIGEIFIAG
jgi:non-ribosomal peptide synthetase component F